VEFQADVVGRKTSNVVQGSTQFSYNSPEEGEGKRWWNPSADSRKKGHPTLGPVINPILSNGEGMKDQLEENCRGGPSLSFKTKGWGGGPGY